MASREPATRDPAFWNQRTTIAAMLFKVMPIDGEIHELEQLRLARILADEFSIDEREVNALIFEAQQETKSAADLANLSKKLKSSLTHDERLNLISHMWEMVMADGRLHEYELLLVERVSELLGITQKEVSAMMNCHDVELLGKP